MMESIKFLAKWQWFGIRGTAQNNQATINTRAAESNILSKVAARGSDNHKYDIKDDFIGNFGNDHLRQLDVDTVEDVKGFAIVARTKEPGFESRKDLVNVERVLRNSTDIQGSPHKLRRQHGSICRGERVTKLVDKPIGAAIEMVDESGIITTAPEISAYAGHRLTGSRQADKIARTNVALNSPKTCEAGYPSGSCLTDEYNFMKC
jgi:hypothetical protein